LLSEADVWEHSHVRQFCEVIIQIILLKIKNQTFLMRIEEFIK